jgi:hypothetical protein
VDLAAGSEPLHIIGHITVSLCLTESLRVGAFALDVVVLLDLHRITLDMDLASEPLYWMGSRSQSHRFGPLCLSRDINVVGHEVSTRLPLFCIAVASLAIVQCLVNPVELPAVINRMHSSLDLERKRAQDISFLSESTFNLILWHLFRPTCISWPPLWSYYPCSLQR